MLYIPIMNQQVDKIKTSRNEVLDFLRGHYLVAILIDHFNRFPSIFEFYNGRGNLWVSAAEGFIFISGLILGTLNLPRFEKVGFWGVAKKIWKRTLELYIVSTLSTILYTLIGLWVGEYPYLGQGIKYKEFPEMFLKAVTLQYSYGWIDILTLYVVLLIFAPIVLYIFYKNLGWVFMIFSFSIWLFAFSIPGLQRISASYFPELSWQFLFFLAMFIAKFQAYFKQMYRKIFISNGILPKIALFAIFISTLILSYLDTKFQKFPAEYNFWVDYIFQKLELGPGRLVMFFVWFLTSYVLIQTFFPILKKYLGFLYLTFGKNSLLTYVVQSGLLFGCFYLDPFFERTEILNNLLTVLLILVNWIIVVAFLWYNQQVKFQGKDVSKC